MTQLALLDLIPEPVLEKNPFKKEVRKEPVREQAKEPEQAFEPRPSLQPAGPKAKEAGAGAQDPAEQAKIQQQPTVRTAPVKQAQDKEETEEEAPKKRVFRKGRPRSEKSRAAILRATSSLLLHTSVQELSIEAIARRAKVGKTTIYRWWPNKTAVVMEALANQPGMQTPLPTVHNNEEAIVMQLEKLIRLLHSKNGATIAQVFSEAQGDEKAQEIFENNFLGPLMDAIEYSIQQGKQSGEFRSDLDTRLAMDILCGPIFFRLMAHPGDFDEKFQKTFPKQAVSLITARE